jgi:spore coat protein U-like protein
MKSRSRRLHTRLALAAAAAAVLGASGSFAATETENLLVSATVTASCAIDSSPVDFGDYDPTSEDDLDGTGTVTVLCTNGTAGYVTLGEGANPDDDSTPELPLRQMAGGIDGEHLLAYQLYSEATRTDVWGNTNTTGLNHVGTGTATALTVYGRIPAGQHVSAGAGAMAYTDTVLATVEF